MTRTSRFPLHMMAPHNTPRHSRESDHIGLWGKKTTRGAYAPLRHADFILACHETCSTNIF